MSTEPPPPTESPRRVGAGMIGAAWIVALGLLTVYFGNRLENENNPNADPAATVAASGVREVVLRKNRGGHYVATGAINGHSVTFLLDTGATDVSVPAALAARLELTAGLPRQANTANGTITTYSTRLARVELGTISLVNVRAHINPHMRGEEVLLGMSFLGKLDFAQRGDSLTLRQHPPGV